MKAWIGVSLVLGFLLLYQNCAPSFSTSAFDSPGSTITPASTSTTETSENLESETALVSENSIPSQNMCSASNRITITIKRSAFDEYLCTDRSRLSSKVTPGPVCSGGATISKFSVSAQAVSCEELTFCGVRFTSKKVYADIVNLTFDNLPWGCEGKVDIEKPRAEGGLGILVKTLALYIQPPSCSYCATSRESTCGACADPGCKDPVTGSHYSIGQTMTDTCPSGQNGTSGVQKCIRAATWEIQSQKQCGTTRCTFNDASFEVGAVRTEPCTNNVDGTTYSCGPSGQWIAGQRIACSTSSSNSCTFEGKTYQVGALRTLSCGPGVAGGVLRCEANGQWSQAELFDCASATASVCPNGYLSAPVSQSQKRFCVAKYEMKIDNPNNPDPVYNNVFKSTDKPISKPESRPWTNLTRTNAIDACKSLGANYDLISNEQWQILAKDIANNKINWMIANSAGEYSPSSGIAQGQVNQGNAFQSQSTSTDADIAAKSNYSKLFPASSEDVKYVCDDRKECSTVTNGGAVQNKFFFKKRTHTLSNGSQIWDLAGNAGEWIKDDTPGSVPNNIFLWMINLPSSNALNYKAYSNGDALACTHVASPVSNRGCGYGLFMTPPTGSTGRGVVRGGSAFFTTHSGTNYSPGGIFNTYAGRSLDAGYYLGFRCVYKIDP